MEGVETELKHNLLYRWFVRLEKDETINDSFRIGLVRLRARLASRLKHDQWQAFLAKTVEQAIVHSRIRLDSWRRGPNLSCSKNENTNI